MSSRQSTQAFEICAKARRELNVTNRNYACPGIDKLAQFFKFYSTFSLLTHSHLDTESVAKAQPRIDVRRKLMAECDYIVSRTPLQTVGYGRQTVRCIPRECQLFCSSSKQFPHQLPGSLLYGNPTAKIE